MIGATPRPEGHAALALALLGLAALALALLAVAPPAAAAPPAGPYPWLAELAAEGPLPATAPLASRFPPPPGYARVPAGDGSFAAWLRDLPVRADRTWVRAHDGRRLDAPSAAVVLLDVGRGDLQQCADTALRLHAEYLWASGRADAARYHFTSGDASAWRDWRRGERFRARGRRVERVRGRPGPATHAGYRAWLQHLFLYAGTRSLGRDTRPVGAGEPLAPGDVLVDPGSPGHAVVVLDVAVDGEGRRVGLLGQGFMPAQELHVLEGRGPDATAGPWYRLPEGPDDTLSTPSWRPFPRTDARRFGMPPP